MAALKDITGQRFGMLTVVERAPNNAAGRVCWRCACDCGAKATVVGSDLRGGHTRSCGCRHLVHGHHGSPEHKAWSQAKYRVSTPSAKGWHRYGGRGVGMCDRWIRGENGRSGFECFLADMGPRPSSLHSLDRWPDPDGDYEPDNCRWATRREQANNRSKHRHISSGVALLTFAEYAREITRRTEFSPEIVRVRLSRGWPRERLLLPVGTQSWRAVVARAR